MSICLLLIGLMLHLFFRDLEVGAGWTIGRGGLLNCPRMYVAFLCLSEHCG